MGTFSHVPYFLSGRCIVDKRDKLKEFIVYVFFGVLTTLVKLTAFAGLEWLLKPRLGAHSYLLSDIISFVVALVFAFVVNKLFVFKQKSWARRLVLHEAWTFTSARLVSFGLEYGLTIVFYDLLWPRCAAWFVPLWPRVPIVASRLSPEDAFRLLTKGTFIAALVVVMNYFFSKWVVFRKKEETPE